MKKITKQCDLRTCFMCRNSVPEWLGFIGEHRKNIRLKKNEPVFKEGDAVEGIFFLYSGKVKVHKKWNAEKDLILRFVKTGDILGHRGLGSHSTYPVSATALEDTLLCYVDAEFFQASLKMNQALTYKLLLFYADELQDAEQRMRDLVHMDTRGRVADALLMMRTQFGCDKSGFIEMNLTRQNLSSFVGATYETVFRIITQLIDDKVIGVKGKNIKVKNEALLRSYMHPEGN
jgi:CRP-like cAMP-binding protein